MSNQITAAPATLPTQYSLTDAYMLNLGSNGGTVVAALSVTSRNASTAVPEPVSLALLGSGLAVVVSKPKSQQHTTGPSTAPDGPSR